MTETMIPDQEAKQQLHEVVREDAPFEQKARDALELGRQYLDTEQAYLLRIDQETDYWRTEITTDSTTGHSSSAAEGHLQETYCRETIKDDAPHTLHNAPDQGWADDPAFETGGNHTYLGVPLTPSEEIYGTVYFVAEDPRSEPFSESETWFAEHLARLLERELERREVEAQLNNQTNLTTVLNRVLRHNLRNDISVIRGYTKAMADQVDNEDTVATVLNQIDGLIGLTEKARELEKVVSNSSKRRQVEIGSLVENIIEQLAEEHPTAPVSVECDDEIHASVLENFDRALEELIENALTHSGSRPTVTIDIEAVPGAVEIRIQDDGPGLPDPEAEVLATGEETPLVHGTGLGLWLAYWIIDSHDGSIEPVVTENGTTMVISIPQTSAVGAHQKLTDLKRSRDKYRKAFETGNDPKVILNDEARIIDANPEAGNLYGVDQQTLIGQSIQPFLPDDVNFDAEWREFQNGNRKRGTVTVVGADATERRVEYSMTKDIVPGQHLIVGQDITEQKQREERLRTKTACVEALFENSPDMVDILNPGGRILDVNSHFCEELGYDENEVLGRPIWEIDRVVDADEVKELLSDLTAGERRKFEGEYERRDGSTLPVEVYLLQLEVNDEDRFLAISRDITDQKERERELESVKERYGALHGAVSDPVFVADVETGELIEVNEAATTVIGAPREEIIGRDQWSLHPSEDAELYKEKFKQMTGQKTVVRTLRDGSRPKLVTTDDEHIPIEISVNTVSLPRGPVISGVLRELPDRGDREQQLERERNRADRFASAVSHDLRGPLNVAAGRVDLAAEECDSQHLDAAGDAIDRMEVMIEDLLELAKQGQPVGKIERVDLVTVAESCWQNVPAAEAILHLEIDRTVQADRSRLQQLLENLMRNAVDHGGIDVTVTIGTVDDGFYVADDGPGIPDADRNEIFDLGYSTDVDGSGFGLSIVKEIVDAHGWEMSVTESDSGGARFEITGVEFDE